ncbi:hypothetical protein PV703_24745 [Streptomyces sp. ME01-24h]|nr:hypothetical protein [Streptomyces sp. ME19-03-3]MDX3214915.1 hypothetical protein [Streptomyces sp. ME02-6991-2B]MDX3356458.1 hypothetical protein [Streptomyces sp. ME01-24h]
MIPAGLALLGYLIGYAVLCAAQPFRPDGKLRLGRRLWNHWTRTRERGTRPDGE